MIACIFLNQLWGGGGSLVGFHHSSSLFHSDIFVHAPTRDVLSHDLRGGSVVIKYSSVGCRFSSSTPLFLILLCVATCIYGNLEEASGSKDLQVAHVPLSWILCKCLSKDSAVDGVNFTKTSLFNKMSHDGLMCCVFSHGHLDVHIEPRKSL